VTTWTRIIRSGPPKRLKVDEKYRGLLNVELALNATPPPEWAYAFANPSDVPISLSMHPPELSGSTVRIRPPDEQFGSYVDHVEMRIIAANKWYEEHVLPQRLVGEERQQSDRDEEKERLDRAKREAEDM
jgi:hypothetical protein